MTYEALVRNAPVVLSAIKKLPDGTIIAVKDCKIIIPVRYLNYGLAKVGAETNSLGIFAMTVDDKYYALWSVCAIMPLQPKSTAKVKIHGDECLEMFFPKGSVICPNFNTVKIDTLTYLVFNEYMQKGNIPWYIHYEDLGKLFVSAKKYAGANVGTQPEIMELIASMVARNPKNRKQYYRTCVNSLEEVKMTPPSFVGLMSVRYSATNTMTKLGGSYFSKGITSALIDPSERSERIETILRK